MVFLESSGTTGSFLCKSLAWFFLEFLESGSFKFIISEDYDSFPNIDVMPFKHPQNDILKKFTDRFHNIESPVDFTYEQEFINS